MRRAPQSADSRWRIGFPFLRSVSAGIGRSGQDQRRRKNDPLEGRHEEEYEPALVAFADEERMDDQVEPNDGCRESWDHIAQTARFPSLLDPPCGYRINHKARKAEYHSGKVEAGFEPAALTKHQRDM